MVLKGGFVLEEIKEEKVESEVQVESAPQVKEKTETTVQTNGTATLTKTDYTAQINKMNLNHLGLILSKLVIFCFALILFVTVGQLFAYVAVGVFIMAVFTIWLAGTLMTLGVIYIIIPGFSKLLDVAKNTGEFLTKISYLFLQISKFLPFALAICVAGGIASIIILNKTEPHKHKALKVVMIVFMSISLVLTVVGLVALGGAV